MLRELPGIRPAPDHASKSLAALPLIQVAQHTMPPGTISTCRLCKVDHATTLICQPATLCRWQRVDIIGPQSDKQRDDLVCKGDGHGVIL